MGANTPEIGAVVVGGGIAGLAAALALQRQISEVLVVDSSDRPGGVMRTDHVGGYVVERGPNTFQAKAPMLAALREDGLDDGLLRAEPESKRRFLVWEGELVAVPMSPLGFLRTPLLTAGGKLRLLAEPFVRRRSGAEESVAEFAGRRLGAQAMENLIGPFLTGVYAGDERELGAEAVFGSLVELERRYGSIAIGGLLQALLRRGERGLRGSYSAAEGLGPFARRLAGRLNEPPALGVTVSELRREGSAWYLSLSSAAGQTAMRASRVVLAIPAGESAKLLREVDLRAAELLEGVAYAPIVSLPLGVERAGVRREIEGFGFLVPRGAGLDLLGCLFMSRLFPGRAPADHELLQCLLGGVRWPAAVDEPDDRLLERVLRDLDRLLGVEVDPQLLGVARWPRAIPQPGRDHPRRMSELRARLCASPGLTLAGSYVEGVSVADSFASGLRAAWDLAQPV
jgi:oxygen-dependent protoporphyrinogen oxidase